MATMSAHVLQRLFTLTHGVIRRNVDGVEDHESFRSPEPGGNCLNWVVGHVVASRGSILLALGGQPVWTDEEEQPYVRGSTALREGSASHSWSTVLAALDESQTRILEKLATISDAQLAGEPPADLNSFKAKSLGELISIAHFHESYHSGQTGILRRLLGRDGAIR
jgi:hypothetical protein